MSVDKVGSFFAWKDIKIVSKDDAKLRHQYLFGSCNAKGRAFRYDGDDYFPLIRRMPDGIIWESCPAKVIFGHNLYEIQDNDLDRFIEKSVQQLEYAGVYITPGVLKAQPLTRLDYNKLILIPYRIDVCLRLLEEAKKNGRLKKGICIYPNDGDCCVNSLKRRKLIIYDKLKEAQEKDTIPTDIIDLLKQESFSVVNVEVQMHGKQEIEREFNTQGINEINSLRRLFKSEYARIIVHNRMKEVLDNVMTISDTDYSLLETVEQICVNEDIHGISAVATQIAFAWMIQTFGPNMVYEWLKQHSDSKYANKYWNRIQKLSYPRQQEEISIKDVISSTIDNFQPVTLKTYKDCIGMDWGRFTPQCVGNTTKPLEQQGGENNGSTVSIC